MQAAAQPAHAQARAEAAIVGNVIVARETVDMLGQRQARLQQDMVAAPVEGSATSRQSKLKVKASTECTSTNTSRESATISRCTATIKCCTCRSRYRGTKSSTVSFI
ncbi:MAG: hypothetical protein AB8U82_00025 [Rickettsia endosymbiont of Haemaphysalis japonica]